MSGNVAKAQLPASVPTMRAAIVGMSGSGKGNCAKAWLATEQRRGARIVVFDPEDEYSVHGRKSDQVHLGTLTDRVKASDFATDPARYLDRKKVALSVVPDDDDDTAAEQCADFCTLVRATGNLLVVFDEIGGYAFGNQSAHIAQKALNTIATKGRHDSVAVLFVSQRLMHIPTSARAQVNALEIFTQISTADLRALEELTGQEDFSGTVKSQPAGVSKLWLSPMLKAG